MSQVSELNAEFRDLEGKGASRRLRHEGRVPAILYGGGQDSRSLALEQNELYKKLANESFLSQVIVLKVGDQEQEAIVKDVQMHPAKKQVLHMDFQRIVKGQTISMSIPIHYIGEDACPGIKEGGVMNKLLTEIDITCLPRNLPEYIEIDVSTLELDASVHLTDLKVPEGVEIDVLQQEGDHDQTVASIAMPKVEAEPAEDELLEAVEGEEGAAEVPTIGDEEAAKAEDDA